MISFLIMAGNDTVESLVSTGVLALLQDSVRLDEMHSGTASIDSIVEELLRFTTPAANSGVRYVKSDVVFCGRTLRRRDLVRLSFTSANRDQARFEDAENLRFERNKAHLAFGYGPHYCVGAELARIEGRVALPTVFKKLKNIRLAVPAASLEWREEIVVRGLKSLPVEWDICTDNQS